MLDPEKTEWLADFISQAAVAVSESPCVIVEVDGNPQQWVQVLPQSSDDASLSGYLINLPFRTSEKEPLAYFRQMGIPFPENANVTDYQQSAYATVWIGLDQQPIDIAHLVGEMLERALGSLANPELAIHLEFGY